MIICGGVDVDSHSSQLFHHTSVEENELFYWKAQAKLKNEQNFFKVFETFFSKENIPAIFWHSCWSSTWRITIGPDGFTFPSRMKRSRRDWHQHSWFMAWCNGTWEFIALLLGEFLVEFAFLEMDLCKWDDPECAFLKPSKFGFRFALAYFQPEGLFFPGAVGILSKLGYGFRPSQLTWSSCLFGKALQNFYYAIAQALWPWEWCFLNALGPTIQEWLGYTDSLFWVALAMIPCHYHCKQRGSILGFWEKAANKILASDDFYEIAWN